ncbi:MAG: hypothetical protein K2J80_06365 [Oscillospiraceae bacterium]|nr:hypothetical protein [Oscillospiraceae bacterium]
MIGTQSFKTAGEKFNVIDSDTEEAIAPYNEEARELILKLNSDITLPEAAEALRKAQKYAVSVYSNQMGRLMQDNVIYKTNSGVWAINERFYDRGIGLALTGGNLETLVF